MMLKKFRCFALVMTLILVVVSCTTFAAVKPIKVIYGHIFSAEHYYMKGDLYFKKLVEKNSKGQILVDIFPGSQLGSNVEMFQATKSGAQQMTISGLGGYLSRMWPKLGTFELPYLIRDYAHAAKIVDRFNSLIDQEEFVAKTGVRVIGFKFSAPRQLTTKFPVNKLEDIKGLKVRVPQTPSLMALWKALGAVPTVISLSDLYTALATGTVDAQENPFANIYSLKFYEQQKYCALTAHLRGFYVVVINNNFWNKLTEVQRKILADAAVKCTKLTYKATIKDEKKTYQLLAKAGMKFTKPKLGPFREKAKTIWAQFGDEELIKKINAIK
jgi:tripartite ATP-independent transporter DctP family solute receptor